MVASVLTVAQQKGGAGKTTVAAHLAVAFAARGRTATVDIDPQGSLSRWAALRAESGGVAEIRHEQVKGWRTANAVERVSRDHDFVVVDSPPHMETEARLAVRAATLVLLPIQPTPMDLWAIGPTLEMIRSEKRPCLVILNRVPPRSRLVETVLAGLAELDVTVAQARLGNRVNFASSMMKGLGITETARPGASAIEISALVNEIEAIIGTGRR